LIRTPIDSTFASHSATSLGRFLGSPKALVGELHQTDVRRHDVTSLGDRQIGAVASAT